jgi:hypothetical protein
MLKDEAIKKTIHHIIWVIVDPRKITIPKKSWEGICLHANFATLQPFDCTDIKLAVHLQTDETYVVVSSVKFSISPIRQRKWAKTG